MRAWTFSEISILNETWRKKTDRQIAALLSRVGMEHSLYDGSIAIFGHSNLMSFLRNVGFGIARKSEALINMISTFRSERQRRIVKHANARLADQSKTTKRLFGSERAKLGNRHRKWLPKTRQASRHESGFAEMPRSDSS